MKSFFESKTNWLMIFLTLIGALTLVAGFLSSNPHPDASGIIMVIVGILGIIVRTWFTNTAIDAPVITSASNLQTLRRVAKAQAATATPNAATVNQMAATNTLSRSDIGVVPPPEPGSWAEKQSQTPPATPPVTQ